MTNRTPAIAPIRAAALGLIDDPPARSGKGVALPSLPPFLGVLLTTTVTP